MVLLGIGTAACVIYNFLYIIHCTKARRYSSIFGTILLSAAAVTAYCALLLLKYA